MATFATSEDVIRQYRYEAMSKRGDLVISNSLSPHAIHISSASYMSETIKEVSNKTSEISSKNGFWPLPPSEQTQGSFCIFKEGRRWKRGLIWKPNSKACTLELDTGVLRPVGKRRICRCPEELLSIQRGLIKVGLDNVKPADKRCWGKFEREFLSAFKKDKIKFIPHRKVDHTILGELFLSTGVSLNKMIVTLGLAEYTPSLESTHPFGISMFAM